MKIEDGNNNFAQFFSYVFEFLCLALLGFALSSLLQGRVWRCLGGVAGSLVCLGLHVLIGGESSE